MDADVEMGTGDGAEGAFQTVADNLSLRPSAFASSEVAEATSAFQADDTGMSSEVNQPAEGREDVTTEAFEPPTLFGGDLSKAAAASAAFGARKGIRPGARTRHSI